MGRGGRKPVVVIGGGRVGRRAVEILTSMGFDRLTVVDPSRPALDRVGPAIETVQASGVDWLSEAELGSGWIVPANPSHLAYEWLLAELGPRAEPIDTPSEMVAGLPGASRAYGGGFTLSLAEGVCPIDCDERGPCPVTGERHEPLYHRLRARKTPWPLITVRSHPLAPGLGGYPAAALRRLKNEVERAGGALSVATACRCHGVVHSLSNGEGGRR